MSSLIKLERPAASLADIFDEFFGEPFFSRWDREITGTVWPPVDINEESESYLIRADIPGMKKDDIKIEIENGILQISGEKKETIKEKSKGNYYHLERSYGSFRRSFTLPSNVNEKNIEAHYVNGVLELTLKKTGEVKTKAIEVKVE